jgi:V8-like Glu-specific endopeptidase
MDVGDKKRVIYGVHQGGDTDTNNGARLTREKFERIRRWIAENP